MGLFGTSKSKAYAKDEADRKVTAYLISRGNAAREAADWTRAALFYEEALRLAPQRGDIHVQHGHMLKEAGDFAGAERAYLAAQDLMPDDADLALQMGHLHKIAGRPDQAREAYERALALQPGWAAAERELAVLPSIIGMAPAAQKAGSVAPFRSVESALADAAEAIRDPATLARLVPELAPRPAHELTISHQETVALRWRVREEPGLWGMRRTIRGVQAIRGHCISAIPIDEVHILLDGRTIYRGPVRGGYPLANEAERPELRKYVFNVWFDFSSFARGLHAFELKLVDCEAETRSIHERVVIAAPLTEAEFPDSDALVQITEPDPIRLEQRIRGRPSVIRSAARDILGRTPKRILVQRTDQLGDMVTAIPAVRRLRELFPEAEVVALVTAANAGLARSTGLFEDVVVIDFPDDPIERRRLMPLQVQEELRRTLARFEFDIAIDLSQATVSRDLLRLSGARFLYGVSGHGTDWLSAGFGLNTYDPANGLDRVPHASKSKALIEALGAVCQSSFEVLPRKDLGREALETFGIGADDRYAILHMGARLEFSRWPRFPELAALLLARTDLKIVMMTEDPAIRPSLPASLLAEPRFQLLDHRLSFDDFDTLVSFATVLVGNDSGPKHLAALRGTNVVTIHMARINWIEWGQETIGSIVSRRVPCAGCAIFHDSEECGKDFACIRDIRTEEVFAAVNAYV